MKHLTFTQNNNHALSEIIYMLYVLMEYQIFKYNNKYFFSIISNTNKLKNNSFAKR